MAVTGQADPHLTGAGVSRAGQPSQFISRV